MAALSAVAVIVSTLVPVQAAQAAPQVKDRTYFAAADGLDVGECEVKHACSLERAQELVRQEARKGRDVTVLLEDGTYRVSEPLEFSAQDGGRDGHTVRWTAAPGARPVISGSAPISGWSVHDEEAGVYVADTPPGVDSRQLYVNGIIAQRAALPLANSDVTPTATGLTINNQQLDYLGDLPDQGRIEFQSLGDFTNRYSPVESIDGSTITMAQPAWDNNTWGWDTVQNSFLAGPTWSLENSLAFLDQVGEWYLDPSAGKLYYKPGDGVDPDDLDVELPQVESLVSISGTYDEPVTGLAFDGIEFTGTSWLGPSTHGYATQQNGAFIKDAYDYRPDDAFTSCSRGCEMFERARFDAWYQEPAAVQVSAAQGISLTNNRFTNLGQTALGIGNDANAMLSGVGLGASGIDVLGNVFNEVGGHGIAVGGVREDAHHPSDPRMINKDIRIENNTVNRVAVEYKDNSGILSTYATNVQIVHNEVANVAYDGIDTGYGWGANDAGGSAEYVRRGYYNWHPLYTTPTTLKENLVAGNLIHHTKARFADGGSLYNLSASPGTVVERNYLFNVSGVGLYLDEGTRYTTYRQNVLQGTNPWIFTNAYSDGNNTSDNMIRENWYNSGGAQIPNAEERNNQLIDNVSVSGTSWPQGALDVMCEAGVAPQYRTTLNANLFGLAQCPVDAPVSDWYETTAASAGASYFGQRETAFGVAAAGADVWGAGGQRDDAFGALYRAGSFSAGSSVSVRVDTINDTNAWAKSGVMVRNDLTQPGASSGYAIAAVTPRNGVVFQWDADGDGYLDTGAQARVDTHRAVWVRLDRAGGQVSASYSYDGVNYRRIGSPVTLPGAAEVQDGGIFTTSHDATTGAINVFSNLAPAEPAASTQP
ncbi:right-handed parallel beta-helix repeat-containing protein [Promicromonospora panici]|uniref:right-handed parallel beta-helix repeat-containing protein n=1 Tax=Promicromonospora panici TaxID=2219658 RepID=UPI00101DD700|nr:right-handed parallel beta-helix repeat-containing protein [Promicromonospora panici]